MRKNVQLSWIAEAEARSVRENALLQRAESEPRINLVFSAETGPAWFDRLRRLARRVPWTLARPRSSPGSTTMPVKVRSSGALRDSSSEVDWDRVLLSVLITDIVNSTRQAAEMGDRHWSALLDRHDDATRYQIRRFDGIGVQNRGDGFLAIFDSPARAIRCGAAIAQMIAPLGISVRSGIHAGEIHLKRDQIRGIAVHVAARIAAIADPGEAFVSKTVRDLVNGSGLIFEDRGIHLLRGVPEEIQLYACVPLAAHHASAAL
jgi:class 3 adenylate cyclase